MKGWVKEIIAGASDASAWEKLIFIDRANQLLNCPWPKMPTDNEVDVIVAALREKLDSTYGKVGETR